MKREPGLSIKVPSDHPLSLLKGDILFLIPGHDYPYEFIEVFSEEKKNSRKRERPFDVDAPPLKKSKITYTNDLRSSIDKIIEMFQCSSLVAEEALQKANGEEQVAIERLLRNLQIEESVTGDGYASFFCPNYIPCRNNRNGSIGISDIVSVSIIIFFLTKTSSFIIIIRVMLKK